MDMIVSAAAEPPLTASDSDLVRVLGRTSFERGRAYAAQGRVRQIALAPDGSNIAAQVQGSSRTPYRQRIALHRDARGAVSVHGMCSCPLGGNCKHVAAAVIAARRLASAMPAARPDAPPASWPAATPSLPPAAAPAPLPGPLAAPLAGPLAAWLDDLPAARAAEPTEDYPPEVRQRVIYVLAAPPAGARQRADSGQEVFGLPPLQIAAHSVTLRKNGMDGATRPISPGRGTGPAPPAFWRPSDRILLHRLATRGPGTRSPEDDPADTLRRILATGRARWETPDGPTLAPGPARPGRLAWRMHQDGSQLPDLVLDQGTPVLIPDPWYVDAEAGLAGPLTLGEMSPALARRLLAAPPLPPLQATRVRAELSRRLDGIALPLPAETPPIEVVAGPPRKLLRLMQRPVAPQYWQPPVPTPVLRPSFAYGPITVPPSRPTDVVAHEGKLYRPLRDAAAEAVLLQRLTGLGLTWLPEGWNAAHAQDLTLPGADRSGWVALLVRELPRLRAEGWEIATDPDFPLRVVEPSGSFAAELSESSGIDWLDLHLGVTIEGEQVDLVPALVQAIATMGADLGKRLTTQDATARFVVPLADGRLLSLPLAAIRPILQALIELFAAGAIDPTAGGVRFTRHNAAELAALEQAVPGLVWHGGEAIRALGRQLREAGGTIPPATLPAAFQGTLRPYQAEGVNWLQFLRAAGLGGVLADDMGLGKTVQTLAHLAIEQAEGRLDRPALIVCPTSLVPNWCAEAERFAPSLRLLALHGPARKQQFAAIGAHDLVITTYPLLARDAAVLGAQEWHALVLDEAQAIKNPQAEATRCVAALNARQRLCLSGTPLQNHLGELWSLFHFLAPGFLGTDKSFRARFRVPVEKHGDREMGERLARRVRPFLLRRTKAEVAAELPPKTEIVEQVAMEPKQRVLYESIRLAMHARVREAIAARGLAQSGIIVLDALLKLRQACCDPRLLKLKAAQRAGSAKLERLMELLPEMLDEGRRVLVFSQFTSMLDLIIPRLDAAAIPFALLTGDTTDRRTPVRRFQAGEVGVFLLSLKAGGTGLNLTAADTVIHYDPWWNPAVEDQATDRAHRIGQDKPVFVHRLVTLGSIEEKMETLKQRKRALVEGILGAEPGGALRLSEADIEALFAA